MAATNAPNAPNGSPVVGTPTVPDQLLSGPFFRAIAKRKQQGRDAKIIVTARDGATGVGKTSLAVFLAKALDTSSDGFDAEEQATLDVEEFLNRYDELERGSALLMDEAEQIDSRRSMSNKNVDASFRWQTRRVNEIVGILTLPSIDMIDRRMERLQDYWIDVTARGSATIYEKKIHPIKKKVYYKTMQHITWPNMDGDADYKTLATMKEEMIGDKDSDDNWVRQDEVEQQVSQARKEAETETRNRIIKSLKRTELRNKDIAQVVGLSPGRISQIANSDD